MKQFTHTYISVADITQPKLKLDCSSAQECLCKASNKVTLDIAKLDDSRRTTQNMYNTSQVSSLRFNREMNTETKERLYLFNLIFIFHSFGEPPCATLSTPRNTIINVFILFVLFHLM